MLTCPLCTAGILESQGTSHRTGQDCSESEDQGLNTMDPIIDIRTLREIIPTLPLTLQLNGNLKLEDWDDMDQVLKLHQLLKDVLQWSMDNKRFKLASNWEELGAF
ncbi:hypothetical protein O181_079439 [Austropuccinia psidii MF-1]|uniref:Uncharacterized protein n=1 Tax=Austropuccinia psidii MF-1 TaxID=1389203 RepID=A0A9Q3II85_9BASI|nr:hypothetical protein [Austropuccinia psidii MF-1]